MKHKLETNGSDNGSSAAIPFHETRTESTGKT